MNFTIEQLDEIEDTIAWNLSFNIKPEETLDDCFKLTDEEKKFIDLFNESKKKDDLADAYLQGIYFIEK